MKERLSLLDVCKIPDAQLHSKTAFFKSIVGRESTEAIQMKDQIVGLSYTVKVIGVQGQQVGILSKRVPLKLKKKQEAPSTDNYLPNQNFISHKSFFAHALVPIKKPRQQKQINPIEQLLINNQQNIRLPLTDKKYKTRQFKVRTKSLSQLRYVNTKPKSPQNLQNFAKLIKKQRISSATKKKSYSGMLKECSWKSQRELINPLMHQQNPLYKKIKKIKESYPVLCQNWMTARQHSTVSNKISTSSKYIREYQQSYSKNDL